MATLLLAIEARRAKSGAAEFDSAAQKVEKGAIRADRALDRAQKRMTGVGVAASGLSSSLRRLGIGLAGILVLRNVVNTLRTFELSMRQLQNVTGATDETMQRLEKTARQLGATTQFRASQAAAALLEFGRAGFTAEQAIAATGPTLDLAVAGFTSLERAAEIAKGTLKQFELGAGETVRIADTLVKASITSSATVDDLGQSLEDVGGIAAGMNLSLEETITALSLMAERQITGSKAGIQLRQILASLQSPAGGATRVLKNLGLTQADVNIQSRGLIEVLKTLSEAGVGVDEAFALFDRRAASSGLALVELSERAAEFKANLEGAQGTASSSAQVIQQSLDGALKEVASAWDEVVLAMGLGPEGFSGVLASLLRGVADSLRGFAKMAESLRALGGDFKVVADRATLVLAPLDLMIALVRELTGETNALRDALGSVAVKLGILPGLFDPQLLRPGFRSAQDVANELGGRFRRDEAPTGGGAAPEVGRFAAVRDALIDERILLSKIREEQEILNAQREAGVFITGSQAAAIRKLVVELQTLERANAAARDLADAFTDFTGTVLADIDSLNSALEFLLRQIQRIIVELLVLQPLNQGLRSFFGPLTQGALGVGAGAGTGPSGGGGPSILGPDPSFIPAGSGAGGPQFSRFGGFGGPAAGGATTNNVRQTINIKTPDVDGFRRSQRQIAATARRGLEDAL